MSWLFRFQRTAYYRSPPPRSLQFRYTRRINFRKGHTMGSYRRDRHTASRNSAGSTTERATAASRRFEALPDPALKFGENSPPGKGHQRLKDNREAILWFYDTRLASILDLPFV